MGRRSVLETMGVDEVLRMNGGTDEKSYTKNSLFQKTVIGIAQAVLEESLSGLCSATRPACLTVADLGCASGPNALAVLHTIVDMAVSSYQSLGLRVPEVKAFLNDLPQNDFNTIFKTLPGFYRKIEEEKGVEVGCFISATPGSFYGRLFPCNSLHFVHSSYSLHWLSQAPEGLVGEKGKEVVNKGCVCANLASPPLAIQAYREQFSKDFSTFLSCRSKEIVNGGRMVLTFAAKHDNEISVIMESISNALSDLASQGLVDKEKLDAFNLPYFRPPVELVRQVIEDEGSFILHKLDTFGLPWQTPIESNNQADMNVDPSKVSKFVTTTARVVFEPLLASEFGDEIIDEVFRLAEEMVRSSAIKGESLGILNVVVSLIKKE